jgi:hypothetical protein
MADGWSKYRKVQKLGQGGFGAAFLVESRADASKKFVVKEVLLRTTDKKAADEAKKEAAFLAQLKHPNIVVRCCGRARGALFAARARAASARRARGPRRGPASPPFSPLLPLRARARARRSPTWSRFPLPRAPDRTAAAARCAS